MKGPVAWMAQNSVAANLLMFLLLLLGVVSLGGIILEVFPESSLDAVQVQVLYPGATPEEIEESIVQRLEEKLEGIEGVDKLTAVAAENIGIVTLQFNLGVDVSEKLDEVKAEVDRITTFPEDAEKPTVQEVVKRQQVIQIALTGNVPERSLKEQASQIKDDLTENDAISFVRISGTRPYELAISVPEESLRAYGLTLQQVAGAVRRGSIDLPAGQIETRNEEILIRTKGQRYNADEFGDIVLRAFPDGSFLTIGDIATVKDEFEESELITRFDGKPAVIIEVYRTADEDVLEIVDEIKVYLADLQTHLPEGIEAEIWLDESKLLRSRIDVLVRNGFTGLLLVLLSLALFMNTRLAFWVAMGILISFMATFFVMSLLGASINMITLFAFILALGIVVDDAIVVSENIFAEVEKGKPGLTAAITGAVRLTGPVTFSVLTTMAAFAPMLFIPGAMGKLMRMLPIIMISVLAFSLIESLFVLPAHLSHTNLDPNKKKNALSRFMERIQAAVNRVMKSITEGPLTRLLTYSTKNYGIVISISVASFILILALINGGLIGFTFFPDVEGDNVMAQIELPEGIPASETLALTDRIETMAWEAAADMEALQPAGQPSIIKHVFTYVGGYPSKNRGPENGSVVNIVQGNLAEVNVELLSSEDRDFSSLEFERRWREKVGEVPVVRSLAFKSALISLGKSFQLEISGSNTDDVSRAVQMVEDSLAALAGVYEIENNAKPGKREVQLSLKPAAQSLGVTTDDIARQVRGAIFGFEALRIQRGQDDVKVMVRLPENERNAIADLDNLRIRLATGAEIPLSEVAETEIGFGPSAINRRSGQRVVTVLANVDATVVSAGDIVTKFEESIIPHIQEKIPHIQMSFEGQQREQQDTMAALMRGFAIALFVIYALLAIPFKSYVQPLVIMVAIPFGFIGAVVGHLLFGLDLTMLSMFGVIGLSGVVVNDSLVLIDLMNELRNSGMPMREAIITAGRQRFRPILLTSVTTFVGVLPLILETSLQAQFLIPMAISLGFGIMFATGVILALVPALAMLEHDVAVYFGSKSDGFADLTPASVAEEG